MLTWFGALSSAPAARSLRSQRGGMGLDGRCGAQRTRPLVGSESYETPCHGAATATAQFLVCGPAPVRRVRRARLSLA